MSQENVEIVQRAFDAFHCGDADRAEALATIHPDVVYCPVEDGPSHGLNAIRDQFERWESSWEELAETAEEFIDAGDRVVVTARYRGRGQGCGVPIEARFYAVYTLRDGRVVRVDEFTDRAGRSKPPGFRNWALTSGAHRRSFGGLFAAGIQASTLPPSLVWLHRLRDTI